MVDRQYDSKICMANQEFVKLRQKEKARGLREKGYGKRPNSTKAHRALTIQDEEMKKVGSFRRY